MLTNARTDFHSSAPGEGNFPSNHPAHEPGKGADERNYSNVPRELVGGCSHQQLAGESGCKMGIIWNMDS